MSNDTARLTEELAAAQATVARLRDALGYVAAHGCPRLDWCPCVTHAAERALAEPAARAALDAALAKARAEVAAAIVAADNEVDPSPYALERAADAIAPGWREAGK